MLTSLAATAIHIALLAGEPDGGLRLSRQDGVLQSLDYGGTALLAEARYGEPGLFRQPVFEPADAGPAAKPPKTERSASGLLQRFAWGTVALSSDGQPGPGGRVTWNVEVANDSPAKIAEVAVRLVVLQFPEAPTGAVPETGMFGYSGEAVLRGTPMIAGAEVSPPVVALASTLGRLVFCLDAPQADARVEIPFPLDRGAGLVHPLVVRLYSIESQAKRTVRASLRFGPRQAGPAADFALAGDVVAAFAGRFPFRLKWDDRRPIGMIMAASSGTDEPQTNPRRWIIGKSAPPEPVDVRTPASRERFARRLLQFGDGAVEILSRVGAQGVIVWDIEGQEHKKANYVGEPHLVGTLAPEMETPVADDGGRPAVDAFFERFRRAGLRVGVCLRAQRVDVGPDGVPRQAETNSREAYDNLRHDLAYAQRRWGCTLFYVDSTYDSQTGGPLEPWVFERLHEEFPQVLLLPENQALRYYTVAAPLDSFFHHRVASTPPKVRHVWPAAFSGLLASEGSKTSGPPQSAAERAQRRAALTAAARAGDLLLFNCWYRSDAVDEIAEIARSAGGR